MRRREGKVSPLILSSDLTLTDALSRASSSDRQLYFRILNEICRHDLVTHEDRRRLIGALAEVRIPPFDMWREIVMWL